MTDDAERRARDVAGARDPAEALARALAELAPDAAVHVAQSMLHRLPAFPGADLLRAIARAYAAVGQATAAIVFAGSADQIDRAAGAPDDPDPETRAILSARDPQMRLWHTMSGLEQQPEAIVSLILCVWRYIPPVTEFWIPFHARRAFATVAGTGHDVTAMTMAALALQLVPAQSRSREPAVGLLAGLRHHGRRAAAGALAREWADRDPTFRSYLDPAEAPLPPRRTDATTTIRAGEPFAPAPAAIAGAHGRLAEIGRAGIVREPITVMHLRDAWVACASNHLAVFRDDATPVDTFWRLTPPMLLWPQVADATVIARRRAVVVSDEFPGPNICHFLCDQAPRLWLYADAGIDLDTVAVIGPPLAAAYQREIAERFGAGEWIGTDRPRLIRVGELWLVSTCIQNQHPAHFGADWARAAIRAAFPTPARVGLGAKLYVSRADAGARRVANEAALIERLIPRGYTIVMPGTLTVQRQAELFATASHVVGPHGAGMTNVAFCAPGTRVLELLHPQYGTYAFAVLSLTGGLDYAPLVGRDAGDIPGEALDGSDRDLEIDIDDVLAWDAASNRVSAL